MNYKLLAIISGVALLLGIPSGWAYDYYTFLRWFISISSVTIAWKFYESKVPAWSLIFAGVAFLFNPVYPVYLTKQTWVLLDFISAILFFISAYSIKRRT